MDDKVFTFGKYYIPSRMMPGILRYIEFGAKPGDFLTAVICNNLMEACSRADEENMANIPAFVYYFYNEAPANCWGSKDKMEVWMELKQEHTKKGT